MWGGSFASGGETPGRAEELAPVLDGIIAVEPIEIDYAAAGCCREQKPPCHHSDEGVISRKFGKTPPSKQLPSFLNDPGGTQVRSGPDRGRDG